MSTLSPVFVDLINFLIPACIFAIIALGLNIQWGHTGLFNGGVAAFIAIGAYTAAFLVTGPAPRTDQYPGHIGGFSQSFWVAAAAAMFVAALAGLLIALPILRLRADYFAIATLALSETVRLVFTNAESLTAGTIGVILIPRPFDPAFTSIFQEKLPGLPNTILRDTDLSDATLAALVAGFLLASLLVVEYLTRSPWGRVLRGIREDEEATLALGKDVFSFRLQAFVLGCAFLGLAGALLSILLRFVTPSQFDPLSTFTIYVMVILGGSGNNKGVVFGAFLFYSFDWLSVRIKDIVPPVATIAALRTPEAVAVVTALLVVAAVFDYWRRWKWPYATLLTGALVWLPTIVLAFASAGQAGELGAVLPEKIPYLRLMVIGAILVLLVLFRPEGLLKERKSSYPTVP